MPIPFSLAFSYIFLAVAANWIPIPVLFLKKVISWSSLRPRHLPFHKLSQLVQVFGFDDALREPIVKLRLFIDENLRLVTNHDKVGFFDRFVVELLSW